ncbi:hypothetical protein [Saprospira grandis]|uniref:Membrane protein n=1 Tax=Saprospira grandis (strain Lewin) TaxID=984262 RepID=H6L026_SAPGL|nr:hypothetical protein [Saprospira grandis]AFC26033.1 membrane protein [Saprospira grandis str. Lewin]
MNGFFAKVIELIYSSQMTNDLYDNNIYGVAGLLMILIPILGAAIFYFGFDKARYVGWKAWGLSFLLSILTCFLICWLWPQSAMSKAGLDYASSEYVYFSAITSLYAVVVFMICTFVFRFRTTNLLHSPF